jgi:hypothetical protein
MQEIIQSAEWQPKEQDEESDTFISPTYATGLTDTNFGVTGATGNTGATGAQGASSLS